ncbi:MAG: ribosomal protein S18-alanine N-acetyltransferase [Desulfarculaceae bacterium]|nr:ribosomal protein S18-alanine N-acetyltransferase [Desulfarculaceae bacterium]MCF8047238.1 ribosomal protein S18-alanine N-acetyltransferase [Desulfarculaceae bacterium]MCF8065081.1 ribosomal protein S18-alanine N-acetyltransferase [Desulfarculaceae bacterium]MCF8098499.1 ribosomal protein S18-alanine N-acetyltransferase [Desulfarculaceae bacterium]MCF8122326.1 ribosomal protein S18-alanine N-acetyltransferase [Desulfarculaceae bacterium]
MQVSILPLAREHLDQVADIEKACFQNPWPRSLFMEELCMPMSMDHVALVGAQVTAFCCMWLVASQVKVQNIAVHPVFQRRGLGRYLLLRALTLAREHGAVRAGLEVRTGNIAALSLYYSLDFCLEGRRPGYYYPEGEDALLLWRDL